MTRCCIVSKKICGVFYIFPVTVLGLISRIQIHHGDNSSDLVQVVDNLTEQQMFCFLIWCSSLINIIIWLMSSLWNIEDSFLFNGKWSGISVIVYLQLFSLWIKLITCLLRGSKVVLKNPDWNYMPELTFHKAVESALQKRHQREPHCESLRK